MSSARPEPASDRDPFGGGAHVRPRVLCVDDERQVLVSLSRVLGEAFDLTQAESGCDALPILAREPPFAVILSDMRMPCMDGAAFLREARTIQPDATRVLLTGYADVESALAAVNEGAIFRLLAKPCAPDMLESALWAAVRQHELVVAERQLLEQTLAGAISLLTDMLAVMLPQVFSQSQRMRAYVRYAAEKLAMPGELWVFELSALLSLLGYVTVSPTVLDRLSAGEALDARERTAFDEHPHAARRLLRRLPRLETVAEIVGRQAQPPLPGADLVDTVELGAALIAAAGDLDAQLRSGRPVSEALASLRGRHDARILDAMAGYASGTEQLITCALPVADLEQGMVLVSDVRTDNGLLVVGGGTELNNALLERLRSVAQVSGLTEPLMVRVRATVTEAASTV